MCYSVDVGDKMRRALSLEREKEMWKVLRRKGKRGEDTGGAK